MKILILVGSFPSETFIIRKILALAAIENVRIEVFTRNRKKWRHHVPSDLHEKISVELLLSDGRRKMLRRMPLDLLNAFASIIGHPIRAWKLYMHVKRCYHGKKSSLLEWFHILPLINSNPDIIHAAFFSIGTRYVYLKQFFKVPFLVSNRGGEINTIKVNRDKLVSDIYSTINEFDGIHCVSEAIRKELVSIFPDVEERCFVNRPAVNLQDFRPRALSAITTPMRIISVGRLEWIKCYDYLLQAYNLLNKSGFQFHAEIVGQGSLYNELRFSIEDLGLLQCVSLPGALSPEKIEQRLVMSDLFVISSAKEGISNSLIEAMAVGLPVIATDTGGLPELVTNMQNGILVPIRKPELMAEAIMRVHGDPSLSERLGVNARKTIASDFNIKKQAQKFYDQYALQLNKSHA